MGPESHSPATPDPTPEFPRPPPPPHAGPGRRWLLRLASVSSLSVPRGAAEGARCRKPRSPHWQLARRVSFGLPALLRMSRAASSPCMLCRWLRPGVTCVMGALVARFPLPLARGSGARWFCDGASAVGRPQGTRLFCPGQSFGLPGHSCPQPLVVAPCQLEHPRPQSTLAGRCLTCPELAFTGSMTRLQWGAAVGTGMLTKNSNHLGQNVGLCLQPVSRLPAERSLHEV